MKWYYKEWDQTIGPFDEKEIKQFITEGKIGKMTMVKNDTDEDWSHAINTRLSGYFDNALMIDKSRQNYRWYYLKGGTTVGPFSESEMARMIKNGEVSKNTSVKEKSSEDWHKITNTFLITYFIDEDEDD